MSFGIGSALVIGAGLSYLSADKSRKSANAASRRAHALAEENQRMQNEIMQKNLAFRKVEADKLEKQKSIYV